MQMNRKISVENIGEAAFLPNPMFYAVGRSTSCRQIGKQLLGLYLFFEAAEQLPTKEAKL